jgi:hypothetical protein
MAHAQKLRSRNEPKLTKKETLLNQYPKAHGGNPPGEPNPPTNGDEQKLRSRIEPKLTKKETLLNQYPKANWVIQYV